MYGSGLGKDENGWRGCNTRATREYRRSKSFSFDYAASWMRSTGVSSRFGCLADRQLQMLKVLHGLQDTDSGKFYTYTGEEVPW